MKLETQSKIHEALAENPNAFAYDDVYDQIQEEKAELEGRAKGKEKDKDRKPKYVQALMQASKEREKEWERRNERKIQKEREAEGGEFSDKESFVTSAYKKKMQEQRELEAREIALEVVEAKLDVTKQKDMGMFYQHLLKQTTGEETVKNADQSWRATNDRAVQERMDSANSGTTNVKRKSSHPEEDSIKRSRDEEMSPQRDADDSPECDGLRVDGELPMEEEATPASAEISWLETAPKPKPPTAAELKTAELDRRATLFARRTTDDSVRSARERYLARQAARQAAPPAPPQES